VIGITYESRDIIRAYFEEGIETHGVNKLTDKLELQLKFEHHTEISTILL
jgi:hypothetical protein